LIIWMINSEMFRVTNHNQSVRSHASRPNQWCCRQRLVRSWQIVKPGLVNCLTDNGWVFWKNIFIIKVTLIAGGKWKVGSIRVGLTILKSKISIIEFIKCL
jgi:hypothetical protein